MKAANIRLDAGELFSKWGFSDGDLLRDLINYGDREVLRFMNSGHELASYGITHATLISLVEQRLLPNLPRKIETFRINTCHNPIRAEDGEIDHDICDVAVWVSADEVVAEAERIMGESHGVA